MDLFNRPAEGTPAHARPLPARMRPRNIDEVVGQRQFLGEGKLLRRMLEADRISSVVLYGPPGSGKTALARVLAGQTESHFIELNATNATVADIREVVAGAKQRLVGRGLRTVLFLDEIHRFNKAQQDVLLPNVEDGTLVLVGATTQNPFFALNSALVSRSQIFQFEPLAENDIVTLLRRALADEERGLGACRVEADDDAIAHLARTADGDARRALSALEVGVLTTAPNEDGVIRFDLAAAADSIQRKALDYDRDGDAHYDAASAFIKSMRGSDPDAALYWMAKMLEGGEDPRFVARRIVICAAEDVGNAGPMALPLAVAAMQAAEFVGMPEARIPLSQAVTYIATAPKSNASCAAIDTALKDVRENRTVPVPKHLRDAHYRGAAQFGHGEGYEYAHDHEGHFVDQEYLGVDATYYTPSDQGFEREIARRMEEWEKRRCVPTSDA